MISGQDGPRAAGGAPRRPAIEKKTLGVVWLVAFWIGVAGLARAESKWRLVLVQPEDSELVTRVEGQTRDLDIRVDVLARGWASGDAAEAQKIAAQRGADFVARIERAGNGALQVHVYGVRLRTLRARVVPARERGERLASSAEMEAAALVLRGELSALMHEEKEAAAEAVAGGAGGVAAGSRSSQGRRTGPVVESEHESEHEHEHENEHENENENENEREQDTPEAEPEPEPEPEPDLPLANYSARHSAWTIRAGARTSLPIDSEPAFGALLGARAQLEWLELGLTISSSLPLSLEDRNVHIRLFRHSLTAEALGVIPWGPRVRALLGVATGVVLYARNTDSVTDGYEASGGEGAWSPTVGVQAELQWVFAREWGLGLGAGLDLIPLRTQFTYTTANPGQNPEIAALRGFEPWVTLYLFGLFGD